MEKSHRDIGVDKRFDFTAIRDGIVDSLQDSGVQRKVDFLYTSLNII